MSAAIGRRRFLEKFTNAIGGNPYFFPEYAREWTSEQDYSTPISTAVGADYGFDHLRDGPSPRRPAVEKVRFLVAHRQNFNDPVSGLVQMQPVDIQIDDMFTRLHANRRGRLWMHIDSQTSIHGDGPVEVQSAHKRWAHARLTRSPDVSFGGRSRQIVPVLLEFARLSDWYAENETIVTQNVTASPTTIEVVNAGNTVAKNVVITIRALGTNGYVNPIITNTITGEWFQINRTGSNTVHRHRVDAGAFRVERSITSTITWFDDYTALGIGSTQAAIMTLVPGSNYLTISQPSGTPNMNVTVQFHAPYQ